MSLQAWHLQVHTDTNTCCHIRIHCSFLFWLVNIPFFSCCPKQNTNSTMLMQASTRTFSTPVYNLIQLLCNHVYSVCTCNKHDSLWCSRIVWLGWNSSISFTDRVNQVSTNPYKKSYICVIHRFPTKQIQISKLHLLNKPTLNHIV